MKFLAKFRRTVGGTSNLEYEETLLSDWEIKNAIKEYLEEEYNSYITEESLEVYKLEEI